MKIAFVGVQKWEEAFLQKHFPEAVVSLEKLGPNTVTSFTATDAEILSTSIYSTLSAEVLSYFPNLRFVCTRSTGFDQIDVEYCKTKGIIVSNVPEYGSHTVAEHTFALLLALTRKIYKSISQVKQFNFDHEDIQGMDIFGKNLGIIGLGKIGLEVLKIAKGFGMNTLVYTRTQDPQLAAQYGFSYVDLDSLLAQSDIVSLHLPYSSATHHILNSENIKKMKKRSYLINTARGGLVETEAILEGLNAHILDGVAIDVLEEEKELSEEVDILSTEYQKDADLKTLVLDHVLINHPQVIITPHNAFNSTEALEKILAVTQQNIKAFQNGNAINAV
jgi:D-lactate dehydrogenase